MGIVCRHCLPLALVGAMVAVDALAQYPGGYPGGYPGQYPQQTGPGIPWPRKKKKTADKQTDETNLQQIKGMLRQLSAKSLVLTADDSRNIEFRCADTTKFLNKGEPMKSDLLRPGDRVMVEANQDEQGYFYAVRVNLEKEGSMQDREKASVPVQVSVKSPPPDAGDRDDPDRPVIRRGGSKTSDAETKPAQPPTPAAAAPSKAEPPPEPPEKAELPVVESNVPIDESDPGTPKLRRGGPARTHKPAPVEVASSAPPASQRATESPTVRAASAPVAAVAADGGYRVDPRIEKARQAAEMFTQSLPAYVCQEQIARFQSTTPKVSWQALDIVSTEVVYEDGKEQYRNVAVNGKPVKKRIQDLDGAWSTGEFGTVLRDLFSPATAADFRYRRQAKASGRDAYLFDFEVDQENSHWHVEVAAQSVRPAYRGSIWIDRESSQALRIEMEAVQLPKGFPNDKIESAVDYQYIRIGERSYLLPVHSESLSCARGTNDCARNVIDFRNYHKYSGESTITFEAK